MVTLLNAASHLHVALGLLNLIVGKATTYICDLGGPLSSIHDVVFFRDSRICSLKNGLLNVFKWLTWFTFSLAHAAAQSWICASILSHHRLSLCISLKLSCYQRSFRSFSALTRDYLDLPSLDQIISTAGLWSCYQVGLRLDFRLIDKLLWISLDLEVLEIDSDLTLLELRRSNLVVLTVAGWLSLFHNSDYTSFVNWLVCIVILLSLFFRIEQGFVWLFDLDCCPGGFFCVNVLLNR